MNSTIINEMNITGRVISFCGPVVTWVGVAPWLDGFAYGDEAGWLRFSNVDGPSNSTKPCKIIESDRSINQVAFNEDREFRYVGACTASHVAVHRLTHGGDYVDSHRFEWGGHGIHPIWNGGFIVPMGQAGLGVLTPSIIPGKDGPGFRHSIFHEPQIKYFYSMCRMGLVPVDRELWACAGRSGGLVALAIDKNSRPKPLHILQSAINKKDYIGVYNIATERMPYAMVTLSRNGEVDFSTDFLNDRTPLTWHFGDTNGVAYSLAAADGHLFILTSKGLFSCMNIVSRFINGDLKTGVEDVAVRHLPLDIIDFAILYNKWILMLQHDKIVRVDIQDLLLPGLSVAAKRPVEHPSYLNSIDSEPMWPYITLPSMETTLKVA